MAYYIFIKGARPNAWELLEKIERPDLAKEVYRNYQLRLGQKNPDTVTMIEAPNLIEGQRQLRERQGAPDLLAHQTSFASLLRSQRREEPGC